MKRYVGLTVLEILLTVAAISILIVIGLTILNPERILASRRDYQRRNHILSIQIAIDSYRRDNRGNFPEGMSTDPNNPSNICIATCDSELGNLSIYNDIALYINGEIPQDPISTDAELTGYQVYITSNGDIVVTAPLTEQADEILSTQK